MAIDEKHRREMDGLARVARCCACGGFGLSKNGTIWTGTGENRRQVLRYICPKCGKTYWETKLADLLNGAAPDGKGAKQASNPNLTTTTKPKPHPEPMLVQGDKVSEIKAQIAALQQELETLEGQRFDILSYAPEQQIKINRLIQITKANPDDGSIVLYKKLREACGSGLSKNLVVKIKNLTREGHFD